MKAFIAMVKARTMEFVRDRGSFAWAFLFPIVMIAGFAFAFQGNGDNLFKVGVVGPTDATLGFLKTPQAQIIPYEGEVGEPLLKKLRQHNLDALVDTTTKTVWFNDQGKNTKVLEVLWNAQGGTDVYHREAVSGAPVRYVDWLVPGILSINIMMGCLFGVGYVLVRYRKNGVLKRMKATPVSALSFVTAQGVSRFLIVIVTSLVVYVGTNAFLHFRMDGSYLDLFLLTCLGILSMIALGLALASRFKSEELAGGIINLITFPMMIFSGVFFSLEGTPSVIQNAAQALPMTHYIQASRAIMLEGAGWAQIGPDVLFLAVFTAVCMAIAAWLFKWE